jgi:hypothetical protein
MSELPLVLLQKFCISYFVAVGGVCFVLFGHGCDAVIVSVQLTK